MKPRPAKPSNSIAQVEGSGTAPGEAKLVFCQDLEKFIRRQERVLSKA
jgi:hypothetical protein